MRRDVGCRKHFSTKCARDEEGQECSAANPVRARVPLNLEHGPEAEGRKRGLVVYSYKDHRVPAVAEAKARGCEHSHTEINGNDSTVHYSIYRLISPRHLKI